MTTLSTPFSSSGDIVCSTTNLEPGMSSTSSSGKSEYMEMSMPTTQSSMKSVRSPSCPKNCGFVSTSELLVVEENAHQNSSCPFGYTSIHAGSRFAKARQSLAGQAL